MKKKILVTLGVVALTVSAYAATRCIYCNGTGFANGGKSNLNCIHCNGTGRK
jgi:DnaJ-class molecular chaperone